MTAVVIEAYDSAWPRTFDNLQRSLSRALGDAAARVEHVGSTSVPGLAAKPIIDIDIVVPSVDRMPVVIERLKDLGYQHRGDQGVPGREAFARPEGAAPHHLYACVEGADELRRHLAFRDRLRSDPGAARAYEALKRRLAADHHDDRVAYAEGKGAWIRALMHDPD